jgi:hypothetical protein
MANKNIGSAVLVLGSFLSLTGCGGVGVRDCPDGVCAPICVEGAFANGAECTTFTVCEPGTYVAAEGTPMSDRVCSLCSSGTYSRIQNAPSCMPWSVCPAGTYVSNAPSRTINRVCESCTAGTMTSGPNQSTCTRADECPAGTVKITSGSPTSAPECADCVTGEYCAGGDSPSESCTGDKWDDDSDPRTACVPKTVCSPGTFAQRFGTATADRVCVACSSGSYTATENAPTCLPWDDCEAGGYVVNPPSANRNRQCATCPEGTYTYDVNQSACLTTMACPAGTVEETAATTTSAAICTPCMAGEFCPGGTAVATYCTSGTWDHDANPATACVPWTNCLAGKYVFVPGSPSSDQECAPCANGQYSDTANSPSCTPWTDCQPSTYVAVPPTAQSDRTCNQCDPGTFSAQPNANSCMTLGECTAYTTYMSSPATPMSDVVCSPCTTGGCSTKYCIAGGECVECLTDADCGGSTCIDSTCVAVACNAAAAYFFDTFASGNASWWSLEGGWEIGSAVDWTGGAVKSGTFPDPSSDNSAGADNMMAGVVIGGTAPENISMSHLYLTSPVVDISAAAEPVYLEFYHWLNTAGPQAMDSSVEVFDGTQWVSLFNSSEVGGPIGEDSWRRSIYNVTAYRNPYFSVRFGYAVYASTIEKVSSWNVDDVRIESAPYCPK